ncbi:MAG TPA: ribbon-helix-helix protein, CopG family [Acidimicrobiales bacterium]|nr:ribbon-helix-helix protein, CopG family [Acidimicrobiales bacterium]
MARTQTMVQLTDDLVTELDVHAAGRGMSRSALIREALTIYLTEQRARDIGRQIVDGYRKRPPDEPDAWGDVAPAGSAGTREVLQRLDNEEQRDGRPTW